MKYVFYINNQGVTVYKDQKRSVELIRTFLWSQPDDIYAFIAGLPSKSAVAIVFDLAEEDITIESFPKLFLWEKNSVRNQHARQYKENGADYVHTLWTGESIINMDGRIEDLLLTSSITSPHYLVNFMNALEEAQVMLLGLYSAPFLLASYFKSELSQDFSLSKSELDKPFFLISRQSESSYRQTFFNKSNIRISRLIELDKDPKDLQGLKAALIQETKLARNYVYNQNVMSAHDDISYIFMDGDQTRLDGLDKLSVEAGLIPALESTSLFFFKTIPFDHGGAQAQSNDVHKHDGEIGLADYVFRQSPPNFYSTPYVSKINNLLLGSRTLIAINSLVLLALLVFITVSAVDWFISKERLERLEQSVQNHQLEKERLQKEVKLQVDAKQIKASVEFSEAILKLKTDRTLGFNINPIAEVIAKQPNIQVIKLDWKKQGKFDSHIYEVDFYGLVYPFKDYYHDPVLWVDNFNEALSNIDNVLNVQIVKEPLNRNLKQALSIVMNEKSETVEALPFQIKMQVNHESSK